eukprot:scaffold16475_cov70-Phaeocystis_antarctica.AAC.4
MRVRVSVRVRVGAGIIGSGVRVRVRPPSGTPPSRRPARAASTARPSPPTGPLAHLPADGGQEPRWVVKGGRNRRLRTGMKARSWPPSRTQAAMAPFLSPEGSPERAGGLLERWLAARAAESEGTLTVRECHLSLQQRAHRLLNALALALQLLRTLLDLLDATPHLAGGGHSEAAELRGELTILLGGTQELSHVDVAALAALVEGHGGPAQRTLRRPASEGRRCREAEEHQRRDARPHPIGRGVTEGRHSSGRLCGALFPAFCPTAELPTSVAAAGCACGRQVLRPCCARPPSPTVRALGCRSLLRSLSSGRSSPSE